MLDVGTADTTEVFPEHARAAVDVRFGRFTAGAAFSAGYTRVSQVATLAPTTGPSALVWSIAPRAGAMFPLAKGFSLWPRAGVTYEGASASRPDVGDIPADTFDVNLEGRVLYTPTQGLGFTLGPEVAIPITSTRRDTVVDPGSTRPTARTIDDAIFTIGLAGSIVLML